MNDRTLEQGSKHHIHWSNTNGAYFIATDLACRAVLQKSSTCSGTPKASRQELKGTWARTSSGSGCFSSSAWRFFSSYSKSSSGGTKSKLFWSASLSWHVPLKAYSGSPFHQSLMSRQGRKLEGPDLFLPSNRP